MSDLITKAIENGLSVTTVMQINNMANEELKENIHKWIREEVKEVFRSVIEPEIRKRIDLESMKPLILNAVEARLDLVFPDNE